MHTTPLTLHEFTRFSHLLDLDTIIQAEILYRTTPVIEWPTSLVTFWRSHS